jgi:hypothetical protein
MALHGALLTRTTNRPLPILKRLVALVIMSVNLNFTWSFNHQFDSVTGDPLHDDLDGFTDVQGFSLPPEYN